MNDPTFRTHRSWDERIHDNLEQKISSAISAGAVTSLSQGPGILLTPNPITTVGTISADIDLDNVSPLGVGEVSLIPGFPQNAGASFSLKKILGGNGITLDNTTDPDTIAIAANIT